MTPLYKKKASTHFFFLEGASLLWGGGIPGHYAAPYPNWGDGELEAKYESMPFQNKSHLLEKAFNKKKRLGICQHP